MYHTMPNFAILVLLVIVQGDRVAAQSYSNYSNLVSTVLSGYNPDILPLDDHSKTLNITVYGVLYSVLDVDVVLGKMTILLSLVAEWTDSQIQWAPSEYGNLSAIDIPRKRIWTPAFVLGTPVEFDIMGDSWVPVKVTSDGLAMIYISDVVTSGCEYDMKFWPFDKQICDISFVVVGYSMSQLRLYTYSSNALQTLIVNENIEWNVAAASMFIRNDRGVSEAILRIEIERKGGIYILLIIFPLYGIACLTPFVFLLPSDSGERIGFSTTIMLSLTVFLDVISDYIPNASTPLPLLCIVNTMGISMSLMCSLMVILSLYFYHKDEGIPVPKFASVFVKLFNSKFRRHKIETERESSSYGEEDAYSRSTKVKHELHIQDLTYASEVEAEKTIHSGDFTKTSSNTITSGDVTISWKDVSYTIDKLCFVGGVTFHVVMLVSFTCYMALGSN